MANLTQIVESVKSIPALPATVTRVIAMLNEGAPDIGALESALRSDEALAGAVLRRGNSSRFGRPGREFSLRECALRLGNRELMKLVLGQKVCTVLNSAGATYGLDRGSMWRGALAGALAAENIAHEHRVEDPDLCFLCALLRDIGKLAIDQAATEEQILEMANHLEDGESFLDAEEKAFGGNHAEIGRLVALQWDLPERIANAIAFHHDPPTDEANHDALFDVVHAADTICLWSGLAVGHDGLQYKLNEQVQQDLLPNRAVAEEAIASMMIRLQQLEMELDGTNSSEIAA